MYIRGFETQNDIAKFLSRAEDQMTPKEFYNYVLTQQNCDPKNFYCAAISIGDMDYVFIVTEHPNKRILYRSIMSQAQMRLRSAEILRNPLIGASVTEHPVFLNDEGQVEGVSTAVVDEQSGLIFIFQAGFSYVRLVTMWNTKERTFYATPGSNVIKLRASGFVETNQENIPEVVVKKDGYQPRKGQKYKTRTWHKD